ncbi:hypothetical protein FNU76_17570 [Chitinimonas arctica]|uniref:Uncharacterized protein n=1 Tax=Chitinimonas arctica TaxID=2594795 RepID=A0A516SIN2_9NEIS|nr:hypothetical protein [Chitinimonas arctica]QDQ28007.1 hypothetical protein FNU76_17570 [Chitinimonas arctica]
MNPLGIPIQLLDDHTGLPVDMAARFELDGVACAPLAKPQGFYLLPPLPPGGYRLTVRVAAFRVGRLDFEVPEQAADRTLAERILPLRLAPGPLYSYPAGTTLISGRLEAGRGQAVVVADYVSALGRPHRAQTRADSDGRFQLALAGRLANPTQVTLHADVDGLPPCQGSLRVVPGSSRFVEFVSA